MEDDTAELTLNKVEEELMVHSYVTNTICSLLSYNIVSLFPVSVENIVSHFNCIWCIIITTQISFIFVGILGWRRWRHRGRWQLLRPHKNEGSIADECKICRLLGFHQSCAWQKFANPATGTWYFIKHDGYISITGRVVYLQLICPILIYKWNGSIIIVGFIFGLDYSPAVLNLNSLMLLFSSKCHFSAVALVLFLLPHPSCSIIKLRDSSQSSL